MRKFSGFILIAILVFAGISFEKVKKQVYNELYLIMTNHEKTYLESITTPQQLKLFLEDFWKKRDPAPQTPGNKVRDTYYSRLKFAAKYFREPGKPGWLTDRGRIFLIIGPPTNRYTKDMETSGGAGGVSFNEEDSISLAKQSGNLGLSETHGVNKEIWEYQDLHLKIIFVDRIGMGRFRIANTPPKLASIFEKSKKFFLPRKPSTKQLHISADVDTTGKKLYIHIPIEELSFSRENGKIYADIILYFSYTDSRTNIEKHFSQKMKFPVKSEDINDPEKRITIPINLSPLKGTYIIDIMIEDNISKAKGTKRYKLKI